MNETISVFANFKSSTACVSMPIARCRKMFVFVQYDVGDLIPSSHVNRISASGYFFLNAAIANGRIFGPSAAAKRLNVRDRHQHVNTIGKP